MSKEQIQGFPVSVAPLSVPLEDAVPSPFHESRDGGRVLHVYCAQRRLTALVPCVSQSFSLVVLVLVKGLAPSLPSNWSAIFGDDPSSMYQNTSQPRECRESFNDFVLARAVLISDGVIAPEGTRWSHRGRLEQVSKELAEGAYIQSFSLCVCVISDYYLSFYIHYFNCVVCYTISADQKEPP